ncbi:putative RecB family exonuclease [Variovorax beijingensis]|uniref:Putative RecB family exonuclease n=1 Tax=Variovorax beijingensis TaxID=2496117 RepID=A0A561C4Q8_9BURK|nr:PD-(D/E)XK nuclease family protein [Variovorax beijingensis]TWD86068.1 putative RecB family exonuclease [Variovorax beijingensis]
MFAKIYQNVQVPALSHSGARPRLSLTSDILSYRHCSYQYGHFAHDGFVPAQSAQAFFGTVVHQVLDRCHRHFAGMSPGVPKGTLPTDTDIEGFFNEVRTALKSHGIRAVSESVAVRALEIIRFFNAVEGPTLYPLIHDTEFRLEQDRADYVLRGVVDVLVDRPGTIGTASTREIWDYKGSRRPAATDMEMQEYEWQMCVYAELYKARSGAYPSKAVLYFLNELSEDNVKSGKRPARAVHEVVFTPQRVQDALTRFHQTAMEIIQCASTSTWPLPGAKPKEETCNICDLRWRCPKASVPRRMPFA